ncbi:MAG: DUF2249 domain-containing protein [Chloroflexi bacterium]|nr:DUF2249 domain-containing protein [Chloroflexota bacterium]
MSTTNILRGLFGNGATPNQHQHAASTTASVNGAHAQAPGQSEPNGQAKATREIDVSHLPPPLPMVRILETLRELGDGETLLVRHTRRPIHLYPKLEELGCTHETVERDPKQIEVLITKPKA